MYSFIKAADKLAESVEQTKTYHQGELEDCSYGCESYSYHKECVDNLEEVLKDYYKVRKEMVEVKPREFWLRRLETGALVAQITEAAGLIKVQEVVNDKGES